jgi:hypothetical protein
MCAAKPLSGRASQDPKGQWRPTVDDVIRISWGKPANKKGTGSRGVPHRLNEDERRAFDAAVRKGFLESAGSGWRKQRRDSPLLNTFRSFCDAKVRNSFQGVDYFDLSIFSASVVASHILFGV